MGDEEETTTLYQNFSSLSSSRSFSNSKGVKNSFQPKLTSFQHLDDLTSVSSTSTNTKRSDSNLQRSQSPALRSDDDSSKNNHKSSMNFQQLDEILEELVSSPQDLAKTQKPSQKDFAFLDSDSSDDELPPAVNKRPMQKSRTALREKSVSWIPQRNTSPIPTPEAQSTLSQEASSSSVPGAKTETPKKMSRCRSEIISLVDGNAPPLPYNIKSKKKIARRIQSIHHIVESSAENTSLSILVSDSHLKSSIGTGTDDEMTSISGSSDSQRRYSVNSSDGGDSRNNSSFSTPTRSRVKYVPLRLQENSVDLSNFVTTLSATDQLRLATLLSSQEAQYGFNMFDALIASDKEEVNRLMKLGYRYDDAVLMIFEKRYNTRPEEVLGGYQSMSSNSSVADSTCYSHQGGGYSESPMAAYDYSDQHSMLSQNYGYAADNNGYNTSNSMYYPPSRPMYYSSNGFGSTVPIAYSPPPVPLSPSPHVTITMPSPAMTVIPLTSPPGSGPVPGLPPKSPKATSSSLAAARVGRAASASLYQSPPSSAGRSSGPSTPVRGPSPVNSFYY